MLKPSWAIITSVALTLSFAAYAAYVRRNRRRHLIQRLCKLLPKVELHAHLHGCARLSTIAALAPANVDTSALRVGVDDDRSLSACFAIFAAIHKTVTNLPAVQRIVSGASAAIENIERLVRQSRAVQVSPSGEAVSLGKERSRWRNVFKGEFINVLSEPNKQLPQGVAI